MGGPGSGRREGNPGNRSRTGMPRPAGAGTPRTIVAPGDEYARLTVWIGRQQLTALTVIADTRKTTRAALVREAITTLLEDTLNA